VSAVSRISAAGRARTFSTGFTIWLAMTAASHGVDDRDAHSPVDVRMLTIGGELGRRIDLTAEKNLLALDVDRAFLAPLQGRVPSSHPLADHAKGLRDGPSAS
jgi:hypothetical protein